MSRRDTLLKIALPLLIIVLALAIAVALVRFRSQPPKQPATRAGALVETLEVRRQDHPLTLRAAGTVAPRRQITLEPQVGGRIVALGEGFASGGFFREGALLLQIEQIDYRLAVQQAEAALARAEVELATTESQAGIARTEWRRLNLSGEPNPLVLYEPQLKNALANLTSARARLEQARLNLTRTTLYAPFDARIRSEQVDVGQVVRAGASVAILADSREAEVIVSLPLEELDWLQVPGPTGPATGSRAQVALGGRPGNTWPGMIERALGEVDPRGRMLQVAVRVANPYRFGEQKAGPPYLEVGMFVDVVFAGPLLEQVVLLPRRALRDHQTVWLADRDDRLRVREVEVLRLEKEQVIIGRGLDQGERVILTTLAGVADGMHVRTVAREL